MGWALLQRQDTPPQPANREFYPVTDGRGGGCPLSEQQSSPFSWFTEGFPVPQGWGHTSFAHSRGR